MALPALDPHPLGCPIGLALTPQHMQAAVAQICLKLRDLVFPTVHVVNPSKGKSYPMLNLHTERSERTPRMVIFPGWEDDAKRRRVGWKRQATLMKRIHDAGVEGESIDFTDIDSDDGSPLLLSLDCNSGSMDMRINDLNDYLGDIVRLTVATVTQRSRPDIKVIRVYAPNAEADPRIVFFPGWTTPDESAAAVVDSTKRHRMLKRADRTAEVPIEIYLRQRG